MNMTCNCCDKDKAQLKLTKSKLLPGFPLYMCDTCIRAGLEPRYVVILAGRRFGPEFVRDHIVKHKYCGNVIQAVELIE